MRARGAPLKTIIIMIIIIIIIIIIITIITKARTCSGKF